MRYLSFSFSFFGGDGRFFSGELEEPRLYIPGEEEVEGERDKEGERDIFTFGIIGLVYRED